MSAIVQLFRESEGDIWEMWKKPNSIVVVTTNSSGCNDGLVMGAGVALEAKKRVPELPTQLQSYAYTDYLTVFKKEYGMLMLQTKRNWKDPSPTDLVERSLERLGEILTRDEENTFHLPRPGCGLGGLNWEHDVKPLVLKHLNNERIVVWNKS